MVKIIFIFLSFFYTFYAYSNPLISITLQDTARENHSKPISNPVKSGSQKKVFLIFKTGLNISNMNFNKGYHPNPGYAPASWKTGYFSGVAIQVSLPHNFSFNQEYVLTRRRGQYLPSETLYTLDYLSLPLLLGYIINDKLTIKTGPHFELLIAGKENLGGKINNITKLTEERSVGWVLGFQYTFLPQFFLDARFMHGINVIGINQRQNRSEFQYELLQISTNYIFK